MSWSVPLTKVELSEGDIEAVLGCLEGGWLTMGPRTQLFELSLIHISIAQETEAVYESVLARSGTP